VAANKVALVAKQAKSCRERGSEPAASDEETPNRGFTKDAEGMTVDADIRDPDHHR